MAAEVEQLVPVRTVAGQSRGLIGDDHADLPQPDLGGEMLKAEAAGGGRGGAAGIVVDDQHVFLMPAEFAGTPPHGVLQPLALRVREHLMRTRLSNIDHGAAR